MRSDLTTGLPPALTASTGMDALAHAIECYTNKACQPISAALALKAVALISRHLRRAVADASDREARAMLLASTMAGMAMNPTRLGLAHALAMPLGSWDLKIPHSIAIAVTLPLVMRFNACAAPERFIEIARELGEPWMAAPGSRRQAAPPGRSAVSPMPSAFEGPRRFGLREDHVGKVVDEAMKSGNVVVNPRETSPEQLAGILRSALYAPIRRRPSGTGTSFEATGFRRPAVRAT